MWGLLFAIHDYYSYYFFNPGHLTFLHTYENKS